MHKCAGGIVSRRKFCIATYSTRHAGAGSRAHAVQSQTRGQSTAAVASIRLATLEAQCCRMAAHGAAEAATGGDSQQEQLQQKSSVAKLMIDSLLRLFLLIYLEFRASVAADNEPGLRHCLCCPAALSLTRSVAFKRKKNNYSLFAVGSAGLPLLAAAGSCPVLAICKAIPCCCRQMLPLCGQCWKRRTQGGPTKRPPNAIRQHPDVSVSS